MTQHGGGGGDGEGARRVFARGFGDPLGVARPWAQACSLSHTSSTIVGTVRATCAWRVSTRSRRGSPISIVTRGRGFFFDGSFMDPRASSEQIVNMAFRCDERNHDFTPADVAAITHTRGTAASWSFR